GAVMPDDVIEHHRIRKDGLTGRQDGGELQTVVLRRNPGRLRIGGVRSRRHYRSHRRRAVVVDHSVVDDPAVDRVLQRNPRASKAGNIVGNDVVGNVDLEPRLVLRHVLAIDALQPEPAAMTGGRLVPLNQVGIHGDIPGTQRQPGNVGGGFTSDKQTGSGTALLIFKDLVEKNLVVSDQPVVAQAHVPDASTVPSDEVAAYEIPLDGIVVRSGA